MLSEAHVFDAETSWNVTKHQLNHQGEGLEVKGPFVFCTWKQNMADTSRWGIFIQTTETCKEVSVYVCEFLC